MRNKSIRKKKNHRKSAFIVGDLSEGNLYGKLVPTVQKIFDIFNQTFILILFKSKILMKTNIILLLLLNCLETFLPFILGPVFNH